MSKWILLIALALGGFLVWKYVPLNQQQPSSAAAGTNDFLTSVPADTVFYSGGHYDEKLIEVTSVFSTMPFAPSQAEQFESLFSGLQESDEPLPRFFKSLYEQFNAQGELTIVQKLKAVGIASSGNYAFYAHGAVPVIRLSITDKSKMTALLDKAVADSGLTSTQQTIGGADVRLWDMTPDNEAVKVKLAVALDEASVTVTLFFDQDDDTIRESRLGQVPVTNSLAATGEVSKLQSKYDYMGVGISFVSIIKIVEGLMDLNANSFGQDLAKYLPDSAKSSLTNSLSSECRKDFSTLFSSMPRLVSGNTELGAKGNTLVSKGNLVWELESTAVKTELTKIRGHVPLHALDSTDALVSAGTGLNMDTLVPALTSLWSQFTQAPFTCDTLVEAQAKVKEQNPAMLQMFLGMAQGVKGLGFSLYDVTMGAGMQPEAVSMLISVASDAPEALAAMTSMIPLPELNGLVIPSDGTAVEISLPMLPPTIKPKAAIKGKFLVFYAGDEGEKAANALATEELTPNGVYGLGFNYRKLGDIYDQIPPGMIAAMSQGASCVDQQEGKHIMSSMPMDLSFLTDFNDNGMAMSFSASVDKPVVESLKPSGAYKIEYLDENCEWEAAGTETFNANGSGKVIESHADGACVTLENTYNWKYSGSKFSMSNVKGRYRDDCDSDWQPNEDASYSCRVLNITPDSFQCMYDAGTEDASIYRYTR